MRDKLLGLMGNQDLTKKNQEKPRFSQDITKIVQGVIELKQ